MDESPAAQVAPVLPQALPLSSQLGVSLGMGGVSLSSHRTISTELRFLPHAESGTTSETLSFADYFDSALSAPLDNQLQSVPALRSDSVSGRVLQNSQQALVSPLPHVSTSVSSQMRQPQSPIGFESSVLRQAGETALKEQITTPADIKPVITEQVRLQDEPVDTQRLTQQRVELQQKAEVPELLKSLQISPDISGLDLPESVLDQKLLQNTLSALKVETSPLLMVSSSSQPSALVATVHAQNADISAAVLPSQPTDSVGVETSGDRKVLELSESRSFQDLLSRQSLKGDQMGERLMVMLNRDQRNATLRMDPPELGQLKVMLNVDGDQVSVQFQAGNTQLRDMLNQQVDRLRQFFEQLQMNLVNVDISHDRGLAQNGFQHSEQENMAQETGASPDESSVNLEYSVSSGTERIQQGLLDIYV
ncbi:flagellar hook-length control protein FliK [Parendozoicomonas sp. Alg238-R29]|uniref:flagellar hook-length control protein FliK n=1 Tax=Parendozoicomonas sp. Alg238-R29 TaxID=2993446 RepID=UPI00248D687B|nr:flagellar hook-length control protein FliK [Parendozoicomonas sp. Alg238-R29]